MVEQAITFAGRRLKLAVCDEADQSIINEIFKWREYRAAEAIIKEAATAIIDGGAHHGFFTLYARALNPRVHILAVEPATANQRELRRQLEQNRVDRVTVVAGAIAGSPGPRYLLAAADSHNHALAPATSAQSGQPLLPGEKVLAYSFSELLRQHNWSRVDLLKLDIEGGEWEVINSLREEDYRQLGALIFEHHSNPRHPAGELVVKLREAGFSVQRFPSRFDKNLGFIWARNKRRTQGLS